MTVEAGVCDCQCWGLWLSKLRISVAVEAGSYCDYQSWEPLRLSKLKVTATAEAGVCVEAERITVAVEVEVNYDCRSWGL